MPRRGEQGWVRMFFPTLGSTAAPGCVWHCWVHPILVSWELAFVLFVSEWHRRDPQTVCMSGKRVGCSVGCLFKESSAAPRVLAIGKKIKGINLENKRYAALNLFADSQMLAAVRAFHLGGTEGAAPDEVQGGLLSSHASIKSLGKSNITHLMPEWFKVNWAEGRAWKGGWWCREHQPLSNDADVFYNTPSKAQGREGKAFVTPKTIRPPLHSDEEFAQNISFFAFVFAIPVIATRFSFSCFILTVSFSSSWCRWYQHNLQHWHFVIALICQPLFQG